MERLLYFIASQIMIFGLPAVDLYIRSTENVFLNTASEEASPTEHLGNILLAPAQYLLDGYYAYKIFENGKEKVFLRERFDYQRNFIRNATLSLILAPLLTPHGMLIKAIAYLGEETQARHRAIQEELLNPEIKSNNLYLRSMGIPIPFARSEKEPLIAQNFRRRPGDEHHLKDEKEALKAISALLQKENITYFADCGTCLGAYRYRGVIPWDNDIDIAILQPDFKRTKQALKKLNPDLYQVQDWSSRGRRDSYLKVYVKNTGSLIDIYCYAIDPDLKTLTYIISGEENIFLPEQWKERERRYIAPVSFDTIFPLKIATLDDIEVPVPNKTANYLKIRYGENISPCHIFDEQENRYVKDLTHPYWSQE
ncbi:LicD family protein [Estrella lausannensis]|uniref:LicD/FKTN/FKRP nucleotidyltransferase domain-containing protein n=1 Tax=Estrella lausannensis TaxID=483423 RepID=A0A0H5DP08_9BACT|nr:LicD family protein [Estrella lausannensis]CRX37608.1 hypothetical protein ELAC_0247 [Estrella lausannensis]